MQKSKTRFANMQKFQTLLQKILPFKKNIPDGIAFFCSITQLNIFLSTDV